MGEDGRNKIEDRGPGRGAAPPLLGLLEALILYSCFWLRALFPAAASSLGPADPAWQLSILLNLLPAGALFLWVMGRGEGFGAFGLEFRLRPREAAGALGLLALLLGLGLLPELLLRLFGGAPPSWLDNPVLGAVGRPRLAPALFIPLLLASSLTTGYVEELYFRVYLSRRLSRAGLGKAARVGASSLLFGLSHGSQGPAAALLAALLGAVLALAWEGRRSWHEIGLGHGLYDFAVLLLVLYA